MNPANNVLEPFTSLNSKQSISLKDEHLIEEEEDLPILDSANPMNFRGSA